MSAKVEARVRALGGAQRLVVKVGSGLLASWAAQLDRGIARGVVQQVCDLLDDGVEVVLVSSGAVALGCERLGLDERPADIPTIQAAAAIGQGELMALYGAAFAERGRTSSQVLLTHADLADRRRYLNARHALVRLLELGAVPVINENDTVAVDELKVGDNDNLAAQVVSLVGADVLILLTDIDGVHDVDPRRDGGARRIPIIAEGAALPPGAFGSAASDLSVGGMATKVDAARKVGAAGVPTVIVDGHGPGVLRGLLGGEDLGTLFLGAPKALASRKAWIAGLNPSGSLIVDEGAIGALTSGGRSLLPAGIRDVEGEFERGEPVSILGPDGREAARGLTAYSADEVLKIRGKGSAEISAALGYHLEDEVVHRDDLVLVAPDGG